MGKPIVQGQTPEEEHVELGGRAAHGFGPPNLDRCGHVGDHRNVDQVGTRNQTLLQVHAAGIEKASQVDELLLRAAPGEARPHVNRAQRPCRQIAGQFNARCQAANAYASTCETIGSLLHVQVGIRKGMGLGVPWA